jgi:transglutaminase superfamily protein
MSTNAPPRRASQGAVAPWHAPSQEPAYRDIGEVQRATATMKAIRTPPVLGCGLLLCVLKIALKSRGFGWTVRYIRRRIQAIPASTAVSSEAVKACEYIVAMAAAFYPGRALCLEQSLVLYYLLRRRGIAVKYCQGVQFYPFAAHAWIEYRGEPITDVAEHVTLFTRLPNQLP